MIELTEQQRQELKDDPPRVIDPQTKKTYVLVSEEAYERMQALLAPERLPKTEQQALLRAAGVARVGTIRKWKPTTARKGAERTHERDTRPRNARRRSLRRSNEFRSGGCGHLRRVRLDGSGPLPLPFCHSATCGKLAVTIRARTCQLSLPGITWQQIHTESGAVALWHSDNLAGAWESRRQCNLPPATPPSVRATVRQRLWYIPSRALP